MITQGSAFKLRISIKDLDAYDRSVLVTGLAQSGPPVVRRLRSMGLEARSFGRIVVASGRITASASGSFVEFAEACSHQTIMDATRHALRSLSTMAREYGMEAEISEEAPEQGLMSDYGFGVDYSTWSRLS